MGVCDDPDYFYNYMDGLLEGMGATKDTVGQLHAHLVSHYTHYLNAFLLVLSERTKAWSWQCVHVALYDVMSWFGLLSRLYWLYCCRQKCMTV